MSARYLKLLNYAYKYRRKNPVGFAPKFVCSDMEWRVQVMLLSGFFLYLLRFQNVFQSLHDYWYDDLGWKWGCYRV